MKNPNDYQKQKIRALKRKKEAIELKGGKCEKCGYNSHIAALDFHHLNPNEKELKLDSRNFSNNNLEKIFKELKKCILLCSNCHREEHHPILLKDVDNLIKDIENESFKRKSFKDPSGKKCKNCNISFKGITGKIFCSNKCRISNKNYPSKQLLLEKLKELKYITQVSKFYNLTPRIIRNIIKL